MKKRFEIVNDLNERMINNFKKINALMPSIYDILGTKEEKEACFNSFKGCMKEMHGLLVEYAIKTMGLEENKFTLEWLENHTTDDNSHILAEKSTPEDPVIVAVYERESYIQKEYVSTILKLQDLVLSDAKSEDLFDFYEEEGEYVIGCAKMLMYHAEDLEDMVVVQERTSGESESISFEEFKKMIEDRIKKEE